MKKTSSANVNDLPMGLSMALSKNSSAMEYFSNLSNANRQEIIEKTHSVKSKKEMQSLVNSLVQNN